MSTDYTLMNATAEIFLMLLAAFLLGWLFCWLMKKLFGRKTKAVKRQANLDINEPALRDTELSGIAGSNRESLYGADSDLNVDLDTPEINRPQVNLNEVDLPKKPTFEKPSVNIDTPKVSTARPRIDLPEFNTPDLNVRGKLDAGLDAGKSTLGKGFGAAVAGVGAVAVGASAFKDKAVDKVGDLDMGIDTPEVSLPEIGTHDISLPDTAGINLPDLNKPNFEAEIDLPEVANPGLNTELDLPKIPDVQAPNINVGGVNIGKPEASLSDMDLSGAQSTASGAFETGKSKLGAGFGAAAAGAGALAAGAASMKDSAIDKVSGLDDRLTSPNLPSSPQRATEVVDDGRIEQSSANDLTRISGIDSQVVGVLNSKGIHTYQDLQGTNRTQLKEYLDATGDAKLKELEPASWPHQATLCSDRNWSKLSEYQSFLTGSNLDTRQTNPTYAIDEGDDLKKVEGIGPFFESLLNDAGITTYEQLKNSDRDTLKEVIDAAGPDYRMHEPETWPYQAGLAHRGEWKKLQDYIHFMTGRS